MSSLFNADYLLHLSKKYGLNPSKQYGQNFLIDEIVIEKIIAAAALSKEEVIVEVGPGFGVLTMPLAEQAGKVVSFEIEKKLEPYWSALIKDRAINNLEIVWGNVLREFSAFDLQSSKYKVVANLPYQITSAVIRVFLEAAHPPSEMILMVQKEVGERVCAAPGNTSLLSVSVQYYATAEYLFTVPRTSFWPSPKVDSAVIRIVPGSPVELRDKAVDQAFFTVVKAGFANRRKLLIKNLLPFIDKSRKKELEQAFVGCGLTLLARAQELSIAQWKKLSIFMAENKK